MFIQFISVVMARWSYQIIITHQLNETPQKQIPQLRFPKPPQQWLIPIRTLPKCMSLHGHELQTSQQTKQLLYTKKQIVNLV